MGKFIVAFFSHELIFQRIIFFFLKILETPKKESKMLSPGKRLLANSGVKWSTIESALEQSKTR